MVRKLAAFSLIVALTVLSAGAQPADVNAVKARVRDLHARSSEAKVTMTDGATLRGRILRLDQDAFTLQPKKPAGEVAISYARVKEVGKAGLSRRTKAILIPAIIGGGVLLALCVAPYPIGYLCRKDPS